jgi:hypothetical protein
MGDPLGAATLRSGEDGATVALSHWLASRPGGWPQRLHADAAQGAAHSRMQRFRHLGLQMSSDTVDLGVHDLTSLHAGLTGERCFNSDCIYSPATSGRALQTTHGNIRPVPPPLHPQAGVDLERAP